MNKGLYQQSNPKRQGGIIIIFKCSFHNSNSETITKESPTVPKEPNALLNNKYNIKPYIKINYKTKNHMNRPALVDLATNQ